MGQGVNMKILTVAARILSINPDRVKIEHTNTTRVANASPTSASTGADLNGMATFKACTEINERLCAFAAKHLKVDDVKRIKLKDEKIYVDNKVTDYAWEQLIKDAYWARTDLSAHAFYAPPTLHWNDETMSGKSLYLS